MLAANWFVGCAFLCWLAGLIDRPDNIHPADLFSEIGWVDDVGQTSQFDGIL